ncbi:hypothetical protein ACHAWO_004145 [Cyclotella atomus]|uniref:Uncharacterized protein n=1 Tax=Cyclotella atomus TaxID=382360 RepID=A0ABD3NYF9_9STRA
MTRRCHKIIQHLSHHRIRPSSTSRPFQIHRLESTRSLHSTVRNQTSHSIIKCALSCEASSLRYSLMLRCKEEEGLVRGWDAGVVEEDDGTGFFSSQELLDTLVWCALEIPTLCLGVEIKLRATAVTNEN